MANKQKHNNTPSRIDQVRESGVSKYSSVDAEWWYGDAICRWVTYLQGVAVGASVNTLAAVAVER